MNGFENNEYMYGYFGLPIIAIIFLFFSVKKPVVARILFFILFAWACWMNWTTSITNPAVYLQYKKFVFVDFYKTIIDGWFSRHIPLVVGIIATCQGMIAVSMLGKGWIFKLGCIGGVLFLVAISPLGLGSGFPCTLVFSGGLLILLKKEHDYIWNHFTSRKKISI